MSGIAEAQPGPRQPPQTRRFRRSADSVRLTPEQRRRQEVVMRAALDTLGSSGGIKTFLNDMSESLGGRPLDVAIDSDDGLARTMALLDARAVAASHG